MLDLLAKQSSLQEPYPNFHPTMAEALLEIILQNLNSLVLKNLASFWCVDKEIEKLSSTLTTIKAVLEDAEEKQIANQALKVWLQKLKDAACVLDNILDECSIKSSQLGYEAKSFTPSNQVNTCSLSFLNPKNMLFRYKVGELHIKAPENIESALDARDANLIGKKDLQCLQLSWDFKNVEKESLTSDAQQVFEALQPHSNLKSLTIERYLGVQLPNWMTNIANITSLVFLKLVNCENCLQLPPLGKLPSLRSLDISGMKHVQYIDNESYDGVAQRAFMSLETLRVSKLENFESFLKEERMDMFPHLSKLSVSAGPRFRLSCLPSVIHLDMYNCKEELLWSISNYHNLTSLALHYCEDLTSFPEGIMRKITCLKTLSIYGFIKLMVLPIDLIYLVALEKLEIGSCPELESFPEQVLEGLCSLRTLGIKWCQKFRSLSGLQHLTLLECLEIYDCPNLVALPNGMNHLNHLHAVTIQGRCPNCKISQGLEHIPCLQSLNLHNLHEVASLLDSLGNLITLESLYIFDCPNLITLPTSFQHLTYLHAVDILFCPMLQKRCKEKTCDVARAWSRFMTRSERSMLGGRKVQWKRKS
ncbi:hypothetical protein L6164_007810 [Bauhinia variegata]|uniref:Uncharacterized protein n=1 Tax=Bauhinia variegata TaxID=167791 RepID=A0ACB9PEJ2_BAUVA|nr:hypothetical protein L6164_007810 [Bauhinia variegata]